MRPSNGHGHSAPATPQGTLTLQPRAASPSDAPPRPMRSPNTLASPPAPHLPRSGTASPVTPSRAASDASVTSAGLQPSPSNHAFEALKRDHLSKVALLAQSLDAHSRAHKELVSLRADFAAEQSKRVDAEALVATLRREKIELSLVVSSCKQQVEQLSRAARARTISRNEDTTASSGESTPNAGTPTKRARFSNTLSSLLNKLTLTPSAFFNNSPPTLVASAVTASSTPRRRQAASSPNPTAAPSTPAKSPSSGDIETEELRQMRILTQHFHSVLSDTEAQVLELQDALTDQHDANSRLQKELLLAAHMQEQVAALAKTLHDHRQQITFLQNLNGDLEEALEKQDATIEVLSEQQAALQRAVETLSMERNRAIADANHERGQCQQNGAIVGALVEQNSALNARVASLQAALLESEAARDSERHHAEAQRCAQEREYAEAELQWRDEKRRVAELLDTQANDGTWRPASGPVRSRSNPSTGPSITPPHSSHHVPSRLGGSNNPKSPSAFISPRLVPSLGELLSSSPSHSRHGSMTSPRVVPLISHLDEERALAFDSARVTSPAGIVSSQKAVNRLAASIEQFIVTHRTARGNSSPQLLSPARGHDVRSPSRNPTLTWDVRNEDRDRHRPSPRSSPQHSPLSPTKFPTAHLATSPQASNGRPPRSSFSRHVASPAASPLTSPDSGATRSPLPVA